MRKQKISQTQIVLNHLINHGYITQQIALGYGVRRLASRINDLRNQNTGINISVEMKTDDVGGRYAFYSMCPLARDLERSILAGRAAA